MNNVLIAVDDTKGTRSAFKTFTDLCSRIKPEIVTLLYVEKFEGRSLIDEMLGDAEMKTLKEVLEGTEYKQALDQKAQKVLKYYIDAMKNSKTTKIDTIVKEGHPAEEILKAAEELGADMIMIGSRGQRFSHAFMGSVSKEVVNRSEIPVFVAKIK